VALTNNKKSEMMNTVADIIAELNLDIQKKDIFFIWRLDKDLKIVDVSDEVEKLLGYHTEEVLNTDFTEFMLKQEGRYFIKELKDFSGKAKNEFSITTIFKRKDKTHVVLETRGKSIFKNGQNVSGYEGLTFYK